jgi:MGT family glycosyltransferase
MAHFAIICPEDAGHLLSIGPMGTELIRRGHRITVLARAKAAPLVEQLGLSLHALAMDDVPLRSPHLSWLAFSLFGAGWKIYMRERFRWRADAILTKAPDAIRALEIDGIIADQTVSAAGTVAEHCGIPFVTVCSALLWNEEAGIPPPFTAWPYKESHQARLRNRLGYGAWHWYIRAELKVMNRYRKAWNLHPFTKIDEAYSPLAQISQLCPEFDFPRQQLAPHFHYIGSLAAERRVTTEQAFPWERLTEKRLILASLGTIADGKNALVFRRILKACAGLDVQLVLALGKWSDKQDSVREKLGTIPANAIVVDFAPQLALLDKAALLITHAGVNTVLEALCRGVPMVALPRSADQPGMGSRIAYAGAGLLGSFSRCRPEMLRGLVERVLADDAFRARAQKIGQTIIAAGGAQRAAEIAEQALLTRQPVLRDV